MSAPIIFNIDQQEGIAVVRFGSRTLVDPAAMLGLTAALKSLVAGDGFRGLILNMQGVTFIASSFLNVVLTVDRDVPADRKPIRICCANDSVRETFELTRLHTKFPIASDEASALNALALAQSPVAT